jgi:hypothetical protein
VKPAAFRYCETDVVPAFFVTSFRSFPLSGMR